MSEDEMLELAAKAMHNLRNPNFCNYTVVDKEVGVCLELGSRRGAITSYWNPIVNDGDALLLAVKLRMSVTVFDNAVGIGIKGDFGYREYDITPDPHAATRWAITHAAAEIGKAMP